jgi:hypothetical protein
MDQKSSKPSQKRRAILQGSLAAPVVLTVQSASATMVTSHLKCAGKIVQPGQGLWPGLFFLTAQQYADPRDTWLREEVIVWQFRHDANTTAWFYNDAGKWVNVLTLEPPGNGWKQDDPPIEGRRWALVWVDDEGNKIGVSLQKPSNSQFTTESCYASVSPTLRR